MLFLDHIAVAASSLAAGVAHVEQALGVPLQGGGQHAHFGTHNKLLGLEDGLYLEVIAIDPASPELSYPRWFDLDNFTGSPRVSNWITRCDDIGATLAQAHPGAGAPVALARGALHWQMAVPEDGKLPFDNLHPAMIEWGGSDHPVNHLAPSGCRLDCLQLTHPDADALRGALAPLFDDPRVQITTGDHPDIRAVLKTPNGTCVL